MELRTRRCQLILMENRRLSTRDATAEDLAFLVDVFSRAMRVHITAARGFWNEAKEGKQFYEHLQLQSTRIIEQDGAGVGFFMTLRNGGDIELHTLCIAPEHQRQGLDAVITRQVIDEARQQGCGVVLSVLKANRPARSFYERLGFVVTEESAYHFRMRLAS